MSDSEPEIVEAEGDASPQEESSHQESSHQEDSSKHESSPKESSPKKNSLSESPQEQENSPKESPQGSPPKESPQGGRSLERPQGGKPQGGRSLERPQVFLDLDQTIISTEVPKDVNDDLKRKHTASHDMDGQYVVFERPHLQEFLDFLFANADVSVWTAASREYAAFIIKKVIQQKPNRKVHYVFYSHHCDLSKKHGNGTKDLSLLWKKYDIKRFNEFNTLIFDDYNEVFDTNGNKNCIRMIPFECLKENSEKDNVLQQMRQQIGQHVSNGGNFVSIVPELNSKFK